MKNNENNSRQAILFRLIICIAVNIIGIAIILTGYILLKYEYIHTNCITYQIMHLYCPGCGATRMLMHLVNGEIYQAFRYNPLVFILIPCLIILYIYECIHLILMGEASKNLEKILIVIAIALIAYGILRNFKYFEFLAPTKLS